MRSINFCICFTKFSSAATNLDNDTSDPKLTPIDWTPHEGYVNKSIRGKVIPRPAPGDHYILEVFFAPNDKF